VSVPPRIVTDLNGRILEASTGTGELLAIEERWLPGKPLAAFVSEEQRRDFRMLLLDLAHGGGPVGLSLALRRRDGVQMAVEVEAVSEAAGDRLEWLLASASVVNAENGEVPAPNLGTIPLRRLLARLPIGVASLTRDLSVEYLNPAARVHLEGAAVGKLLPDPWPEFSLRKFARRLFTATPPPRQLVETAHGRLLELDGIAGTGADSALVLLRDVTSRERRRRAEREFVSNAAHELRTPIAAIVSALEVLQGGAKDVPADRDLFLAHLERESERLGRLVAALLLLARIQTGQETPTLQLVEVAPLLDAIGAQLQPGGQVSIRIECPPGVAMLADPDLLRQAVWNLATNAAAHTARGEIVLAGRDLGRMSEIEVRDTGPGIDKARQPHVFERFVRGHERAGGGFGLGLPIAREIALALGGTVTLDSTVGVGTRARIRVPSARLVQT
jgi:signal transduction histidine kinase